MRYFDHNATTPLCEAARDAWLDASRMHWANASASYRMAAQVRAVLSRARERMAECLAVEPDSLVFCSGATEACNLWLRSTLEQLAPEQCLLVSELEHSCVVEPATTLVPERIRWFRPSSRTDLIEQLEALTATHAHIAGVVMMAANNVTGEVFDWHRAATWCRERGLAYFCDATQFLGKLPLSGWSDVHAFCGSAHKFGGPKGVGFLKQSGRFGRICGQLGGGQEAGIRAGTEDVPGILAMQAALEGYVERASDASAIRQRILWRQQFQDALAKAIPGVRFLIPVESSLWNTVSVILPQDDATRWIERLDRLGVAAAAGSACSTGNASVSRVLLAMGVDEAEARRHLRFSAGWQTTEQDWQELLRALTQLWREGDEHRRQGGSRVISIDDL